ncbi:hypothetical protein GJ496_009690 [Pomphorhynchus laevis]|nr:hypothetical protein GJ496_009690 [Pomphorhynchus laevis]
MNRDEEHNYIWEGGYEKTWEVIKEDEEGFIGQTIQELIDESARKQRTEDSRPKRLGVMRHCFIVLDISLAMNYRDFKPLRIKFIIEMLKRFVDEFYRFNPIAQIGLITTSNGRADLRCSLTTDSNNFKSELIALADMITDQDKMGSSPSIQNAAILALRQLQYIPMYSCREIIFIMGSLSTIDPGNINETIGSLKTNNIRCSVISLSAEVFIHKHIAKETKGRHIVALNEEHFYQQLIRLCEPEIPSTQSADLVPLAFPLKLPMEERLICMQSDHSSSQCNATYICPRCQSAYCSLPVVCNICSLTLVSGTELNRSIHYLFPLPIFEQCNDHIQNEKCEVEDEEMVDEEIEKINVLFEEETKGRENSMQGGMGKEEHKYTRNNQEENNDLQEDSEDGDSEDEDSEETKKRKNRCHGCLKAFDNSMIRLRCPKCKSVFCNSCDRLLHTLIFSCPGCCENLSEKPLKRGVKKVLGKILRQISKESMPPQ